MTAPPLAFPNSDVNRQAERRLLAQECFRAAHVFDCPSLAEEGLEYLDAAGPPLAEAERQMLLELWNISPQPRAPTADAELQPATKPARRQRKPSIATLIKQANKAGVPVRSVRLEPDGSIAIDIGEPEPAEASNPWRRDLEGKTKR